MKTSKLILCSTLQSVLKALESGPRRHGVAADSQSGGGSSSGGHMSLYYVAVQEAPTAAPKRDSSDFFVDPDSLVPYVNTVLELLNDLRHCLPFGTLLSTLRPQLQHSLLRISHCLQNYHSFATSFCLNSRAP